MGSLSQRRPLPAKVLSFQLSVVSLERRRAKTHSPATRGTVRLAGRLEEWVVRELSCGATRKKTCPLALPLVIHRLGYPPALRALRVCQCAASECKKEIHG